ncbi:TrkH family potassium uptake protein [Nocardioidaceae bacterium]|nr:TrkH family potassium uptake protein [Nocardioidaceae bacterium]
MRRAGPGRLVVGGFVGTSAIGTVLLLLPVSRAGDAGAGFMEALFTSVSAVCVTGLIVVDTPVYWSGFGQAMILLLIQVGGFGAMTFASLLGLLLYRRLGMRTRVTAAAETKTVGIGDVRTVVKNVAITSLQVEAVVATILTLRFWLAYGDRFTFGEAVWQGVFHAVSAFNNAGFSLFSDSLIGYVADPFIIVPVVVAVVLGGIGFPVILELRRRIAPRQWNLHVRLTLIGTGVLLVGGWIFFAVVEWGNQGTLGSLGLDGKLLGSLMQSAMPRTAGFNSVDTGAMSDEALLGTIVLMFIGGGSAGTAGGIKVTTAAILVVAVITEVRGERDVTVFRRRVDDGTVRQAFTLFALASTVTIAASMLLMVFEEVRALPLMFEAVSAFGTVGLSTGVTGGLDVRGELLLVVLMLLGRIGPITAITALALRQTRRHYRYPEGRPIIG